MIVLVGCTDGVRMMVDALRRWVAAEKARLHEIVEKRRAAIKADSIKVQSPTRIQAIDE